MGHFSKKKKKCGEWLIPCNQLNCDWFAVFLKGTRKQTRDFYNECTI